MKTITIAALLAPMLALAGCGSEQSAPAPAPRAKVAKDGTDYQAAVAALSVPQRNGVFIRAIRDAGLPCQGVTKSDRLGDTGSVWRARCEGGVDHVISIEGDGNARVSTSAISGPK